MAGVQQVSRRNPTGFFLGLAVAIASVVSPGTAKAATYTWSSATLGGLWSSAVNWNPSTGTPIAGDTAVLDTVSGTTRVVTYDTAASGAFATLTLNQAGSGTNTFEVQKNLTVSNTITLGASGGGLARLLLSPSSGTTNSTTTTTASVVINPGGMLTQMAYNPSGTNTFGRGDLTGNVTVQGGLVVADTTKLGSGGSVTTSVTGTFTMTSGTLSIVNPSAVADRRFSVKTLNVTGGDVLTTATNGNLATITITATGGHTFNPTNFSSTAAQISIDTSTAQLASNQILNMLIRGNGTKTFTSSLSGTNFGSLSLVDGDVTAAGNTFKLGSNLTLASGRALPNSSAPSALAAQRFDVGIDLSGFTMNLSSNSGTFTPNTPYGTGTAVTYWTFTGSGGSIIANGFNLSGTGVATSVGPGVILESKSGNNGANSLSLGSGTGSLTIDPTSIFRYSGAAAVNTPATLVSTRSIGDVEVTSGALNVTGLAGMGAMRVTGGTLIATNTTALPASAASLTVANGATVLVGNAVDDAAFAAFSTGTGVAAGATFGFDTSAGDRTYASALASGLGFTKLGGNTLSLTASSSPASVTLNGGTTIINPGDGGSFSTTGRLSIGNLSGLSTATVMSGSVGVAPVGSSQYITLGDSASGTATLNVSGGVVILTSTSSGGRMMVGNKGTGTVNVSGGSLTYAGGNALHIGGDSSYAQSNAKGTLTISGGTMAITGAGSFVLANSGTNGNANTGVVGTLNLNGGEFHTIRPITAGTSGTAANAQSSYVNFNGGLLKPLASSTAFMQGLTAAYVQNGGARIDTNGYDITIGQALLTGTGSTGGLTKSGAGTLTLTGTSTYTGATTISGGTLALSGGTNRLRSSSALAFTGGSVAITGTTQVLQTVASLTVADSTSAAVVNASSAATTLTVTSAVSLGGGSGTASLLLQPTTSNAVFLGVTNGVTLNAGGELRLGAVITGPNTYYGSSVTGPLSINGGSLILASMTGTAGGFTNNTGVGVHYVGPLTMSDGRVFIDNTGSNSDRRLSLNGNTAITGGTFAQATGAFNGNAVMLSGSTTGPSNALTGNYTFNVSPASYDPYLGMSVFATGTTSLTLGMVSGQVPYQLIYRNWGLQVLSSTAAGNPIANLLISDASSTSGVGNTVRLGSNLTLVASGALPQQTNYSLTLESGTANVGIDADGYTFDMTANSGRWTPNASPASGTTAQTYWQLSSTSGTGRFIANGFNFVYASGSNNAYTAVGPNVILDSTSGNSVANNLGSGGTSGLVTIDPSSIFRYSGTAATATPSTLTSARSIGNLEVAGSGALKVLAISGSVGNVSVSNGRLILGGTSIPVLPSLAVTGGTFDLAGYASTITDLTGSAGGTITTSSNTSVTLTVGGANSTRFDGTIANAAGTLNLVKQDVGSLTLGGVNTFAGTTRISGGTLAQGVANALGSTGGALAVDGGTLDLGGFGLSVGMLSGSAGGVITSGSAGAVTFAAASASDSTFAGLIQDGAGTVGFTKGGAGKLTLTAANTYTGPTVVNGGVLAVNGSLAGAVTVAAGGEIGGSGSIGAIAGAGLVGPGNSPGILTAPSVDPSNGTAFAFEFTQAVPNYASPTASDNDLLWLTGGTQFTASLSGANTVSIYLTPSAVELSDLTGGFFTQTAGDFFASIQSATFQYFVQDAQGSFTYNGQAYKTLSQYDASKSITVSTVAQNGGQVMQMVVVPEPGALALAGLGVAVAAWGWSRRKTRA